MYVIRVLHTAAQDAIGADANQPKYVPADRCTWEITEPSTGGYQISDVHYIDGTTANAVALNGTFVLGYMGKTGRFVEITN